MGEVYRARDQHTHRAVALKIMRRDMTDHGSRRFEREARLLAKLSHPCVVKYVAHGVTPDGRPYMAMEWLEGHDLDQHLRSKGPLALDTALELLRRAAEGLAEAHRHGIVHRDLKPTNLFLVDGEPARVKLLDFGVAHVADASRALTSTGAFLGTAGYVAPELASGAREIGPTADVFSLGCVLFECLTGEAAFGGKSPLEALASVLLHEPPPLASRCPAAPRGLENVFRRMIAKDPKHRFATAQAVLGALDPLGSSSSATTHSGMTPLTERDRRLISVVLLSDEAEDASSAPTVDSGEWARALEALRGEVDAHGGQLTSALAGGALISVSGTGNALDDAARAARCALAARRAVPGARIALATGLAQLERGAAVGPVMSLARSLLEHGHRHAAVDETTARLLDARFELVRIDRSGAALLVAERSDMFATRSLLGKPTPLVGRDKELALLCATWSEVVAESVARTVLVTGAPGMGKSRLCSEMLERLRAQPGCALLLARGEALGAGASLRLARQLVRGAARRLASVGTTNMSAHFELLEVDPAHRPYLEELLGVAPEDAAPELLAARADPIGMRPRLEAAFVHWLGRIAALGPVAVVVDDVQWCDLPSLELLEQAARELRERPLLMFAVGRPEVERDFPGLWRHLDPQQLRLGRLSKRAAEQLVRAVVGGELDEGVIAALVDQADGNAFSLEEMVRWRAAGGHGDAPDTVLAVVQARLSALEPGARITVRAASVLGEDFEIDALVALLGDGGRALVDAWIEPLTTRDVLTRGVRLGRCRFRHALVHDAAYGLLAPEDRRDAHVRAAEWLEARAHPDAVVIAEHYERGGEASRAIPWLFAAAHEHLFAGHLEAALRFAEKGTVAGAEGAILGELLTVRVNCLGWLGRFDEVFPLAEEAMRLVPLASTLWFRNASTLLFAAMGVGKPDRALGLIPALTSLEDDPEPSGPYGRTAAVLILGLLLFGQHQVVELLMARLRRSAKTAPDAHVFHVWVALCEAHAALYQGQPLATALEHSDRAMELLGSTEEPIAHVLTYAARGLILAQLHRQGDALEACAQALARAERTDSRYLQDNARMALAMMQQRAGDTEAALAATAHLAMSPQEWTAALARATRARTLLRARRFAEARAEGLAALERTATLPAIAIAAQCTLAVEALARAAFAEALDHAERGLEHVGVVEERLLLRQVAARALTALGREREAEAARDGFAEDLRAAGLGADYEQELVGDLDAIIVPTVTPSAR